MGITVGKNATTCKLTAMTNRYAHKYYVYVYVQNLNLLQPKLWPVLQFTDPWATMTLHGKCDHFSSAEKHS